MSEEHAVFIDHALMDEIYKACHELFQKPPRDFVTVALGISGMLGMPVYDLRSCLEPCYNSVREAMFASGVSVRDASTSEQVAEAIGWMNRWMPRLPQTRWQPIDPIGPTPDEVTLKAMMARALSTPTPEAVLDFTRNAVKQRKFGPYNILMIYAQRPGAGFVASRSQWLKLGHDVRDGSIPILILYPRGPITQVFEELDVVPPLSRLPEDDEFGVTGEFDPTRLSKLIAALAKPGKRKMMVKLRGVNVGRSLAGWINGAVGDCTNEPPRIERMHKDETGPGVRVWEVSINQKHRPAEQFVTLLHELGHLFCGHVGEFNPANQDMDESGWPDRRSLPYATKEIEAELVAWWLAEREGMVTGSPLYLKTHLEANEEAVAKVNLDRVTRAVARVRSYLGDKVIMTDGKFDR